MLRRPTLLKELVRVLVAEWGYKEVQRALSDVLDAPNVSLLEPLPGDESTKHVATKSNAGKRKRLTAIDYVNKLEGLSDNESKIIKELASRFDQREFLPGIGDIREFLIMNGRNPRNTKNRSEAFRDIFPILKNISTDNLKNILNSVRYSGPARLGPLSDAIKAAGDALRRSEKTSGTDQDS